RPPHSPLCIPSPLTYSRSLFFSSSRHHPHLHSFPTRRSSDLLGILPGHAPLLSELKAGELSYTQDDATHYVAVSWGFAEVLPDRSEEHTSELQSRGHLVCRLLLEKKNKQIKHTVDELRTTELT